MWVALPFARPNTSGRGDQGRRGAAGAKCGRLQNDSRSRAPFPTRLPDTKPCRKSADVSRNSGSESRHRKSVVDAKFGLLAGSRACAKASGHSSRHSWRSRPPASGKLPSSVSRVGKRLSWQPRGANMELATTKLKGPFWLSRADILSPEVRRTKHALGSLRGFLPGPWPSRCKLA